MDSLANCDNTQVSGEEVVISLNSYVVFGWSVKVRG